jgi:hypothetical protein
MDCAQRLFVNALAVGAEARGDGTGPHNATVMALAQTVPYRWDRPVGQASEQMPGSGCR